MDLETQIGMKAAIVGTGIYQGIAMIGSFLMASLLPNYVPFNIGINDYQGFLSYLIMANIIGFVMMPVLLTLFINDAGELENFTKKGMIERAWLVNIVGVIVMIVAGAIMGWAMSSFFTGWEPISDPQAVYGNAIKLMNLAMMIQALGFAIPLVYFMLSKLEARERIPFSRLENAADKLGVVFGIAFMASPVALAISPLSVGIAGLMGIVSGSIGIAWCLVYVIAVHKRALPDVPED